MRPCLVSYEFPPVGAGEGTYTYNLASGLADLGHEVFVLIPEMVCHEADDSLSRLTLVPIRTLRTPSLRVSSFLGGVRRKLPSLLQKYRIDLVHLTFDYPSFLLHPLRVEKPTVATIHHLHWVEAVSLLRYSKGFFHLLPYLGRQFLLSNFEKKILHHADAVVAVSKFTTESVVHYTRIPLSRIRVIPDGIDPLPFLRDGDGARFRRKFGLSSEQIVLYVGRIEASKGLQYLISSFQDVRRRRPTVRLVIIGQGRSSYAGSLRRQVTQAGIGSDVTFTGRVGQETLLDAYSAASVVVLPSLMEGFGITLLEAMAAGKPCVATRVGAVPEVVRDGVTGILVGPGKPRELANCILRILEDVQWGESLGRNGRDLVLSEFTVEKMARATARLYQELL